jgi:hypothetical protein
MLCLPFVSATRAFTVPNKAVRVHVFSNSQFLPVGPCLRIAFDFQVPEEELICQAEIEQRDELRLEILSYSGAFPSRQTLVFLDPDFLDSFWIFTVSKSHSFKIQNRMNSPEFFFAVG